MAEPLPLFDYQNQGADLMATRERFGLHDEMGIGKTATTIGTMDRLGLKRGIVVAPAMLRQNWINEFGKFATMHRRLCKGTNIHDFVAWQRGRFDVLVTSYEQATRWTRSFVKEGEFIEFLAFDEGHYLKNHEAQRTRAMLGLEADGLDCMSTFAEHAWHITGTPMSNDPMDIYTFLRFVGAMDLSVEDFVAQFFIQKVGAYSTRHFPKDEMIPTLQQLIYNNSIRRTHEMVGLQLPEIFMTETLIEGKTVDIYKAMEAYPHLEDIIVNAILTDNLAAMDATHIAIIRRLVGKAKAVPYAELLKSELDQTGGKRVVFCWHVEPLLHVRNYLCKHGYDAVAVYGGTPDHEAEDAVERFQNDPKCRVFVGNIKKAGTGLTLTASDKIDMLESDWSPAGNAQALKRVHRYGQTNTVHARFITLADSIDVSVNQIVAGKTASIAKIEGHTMTASPLDL